MRSRNRFVGLVLLVLGAALVVAPATARADIHDELNVSDYTLQRLALPAEIGQGFDVVVNIAGQQQTLALEPFSVRVDDFKVSADVGGGLLQAVDVGAPKTVRGEVLGVPGSVVAGSLLDDGLTATVIVPGPGGDEHYWVQPAPGAGDELADDAHVVYASADVLPDEFVCGVDHDHVPVDHAHNGGGTITPADPLFKCEIAYDADFVYYGQRGSSVQNVVNDIENITAVFTIAYERDCAITYEITEIIVRTTSGLYANPDPNTMLNQFRTQWNRNHTGVQRDVAHLMTGRNLSGSTIGIAWLGVICNLTSSYGLSQTTFTGNTNARAALTAHEIGHNWSAQHCNGAGGGCHIMCSGLGGCNGIGNPIRFGSMATSQITSFRNSRPCLDEISGALDLPFFDPFPSGSFDGDLWAEVNGATVGQPINPPSSPWAANLDSTDSIVTQPLNAEGAQEPVVLSFEASNFFVDECESLHVEFLDQGGDWQPLGAAVSDGSNLPFTHFAFELPPQALYEGVQVRFRVEADDAADDWYVDDVLIEANGVAPPPAGIDLPLFHDFPCDILDEFVWGAANGTLVTDEATNEPSGPYSLRVQRGEWIDSVPMRAGAYGHNPLFVNFWVQERDLESGDALAVMARMPNGNFEAVGEIDAGTSPPGEFTLVEFQLPAGADHDDLVVRFRSRMFEGDDTWFIDDVGLSEESLVGGGCPADMDGDGDADVSDFFAFLDLFAAGHPDADVNGDGAIDVSDFFSYLDFFAQGC